MYQNILAAFSELVNKVSVFVNFFADTLVSQGETLLGLKLFPEFQVRRNQHKRTKAKDKAF